MSAANEALETATDDEKREHEGGRNHPRSAMTAKKTDEAQVAATIEDDEDDEDDEEEETKEPTTRTDDGVVISVLRLPLPGSQPTEASAHRVPKSMRGDLSLMFPLVDLDTLLVVPVVQRTSLDILTVNQDTDVEKDDALERFVAFAAPLCERLTVLGHFADFADPCSGLPMRSDTNVVYPEILGLEKLRRFYTTQAGCCRVAMHPRWGACMYPASIFTTAPAPVLLREMLREPLLDEVDRLPPL